MGAVFDELESRVTRATSVAASAAMALHGVADRILAAVAEDNIADNTKIAQLGAELEASSDSLAAAVAANTVAEDEPEATTDGVLLGDDA